MLDTLIRYIGSKLEQVKNNKLYPTLVNKYPTFVPGNEYTKNLRLNYSETPRPMVLYKHWPELKIRPVYSGVDKISHLVYEKIKTFKPEYPQMCFFPAEEFIESLEYKRS